MQIEIFPVAYASLGTLVNSIEKVVINPLIIFLFALALVYFLYGVLKLLLNPENEEVRKTSKTHMLWGLIGIFIMVAVFGIIRLILNTVGENRVNVQDNGNITVTK
jgi:peptidoglycan/LPS O-acetylase OafA/YrhL